MGLTEPKIGGSRSRRARKSSNTRMKTITFSIFKGGTGKTTSAVSTAAALARKGWKVLLVDLDQQASATRYFGLDPESSPNLYEVYMGIKPAALAPRPSKFGVDLLTSHPFMAAIEEALEPGDETKLSELLMPLKADYDFIIIDSPPGKAMLAFNGLAAADLIVITASAERMAVDGVADLINYVQKIMWSKLSLEHQELRILFTMYRSTTTHSPAIVSNAQKIWRENVLSMKIPHSTIFSRSYDEKKPIGFMDPKHPGALAYDVFADWLVDYEATTN
ncbi:MAG: ParA family protein [Chloroflexota bacterium]